MMRNQQVSILDLKPKMTKKLPKLYSKIMGSLLELRVGID